MMSETNSQSFTICSGDRSRDWARWLMNGHCYRRRISDSSPLIVAACPASIFHLRSRSVLHLFVSGHAAAGPALSDLLWRKSDRLASDRPCLDRLAQSIWLRADCLLAQPRRLCDRNLEGRDLCGSTRGSGGGKGAWHVDLFAHQARNLSHRHAPVLAGLCERGCSDAEGKLFGQHHHAYGVDWNGAKDRRPDIFPL